MTPAGGFGWLLVAIGVLYHIGRYAGRVKDERDDPTNRIIERRYKSW